MKLTLPTWLTLLRIVMIPVLVLVFYLPYTWTNFASAAIFGLAAITDWLDGWIARRYQLESAFGAFLDPVADKLMVAVALFLIVQGHPTPWMAFWAAVIVGREIAVSALREWMAELGQRAKVRVAMIGKIKTTAQMVALLCLLYSVAPTCRWKTSGWAGRCSISATGPGDCGSADPVVGPAVPACRLAEPARRRARRTRALAAEEAGQLSLGSDPFRRKGL